MKPLREKFVVLVQQAKDTTVAGICYYAEKLDIGVKEELAVIHNEYNDWNEQAAAAKQVYELTLSAIEEMENRSKVFWDSLNPSVKSYFKRGEEKQLQALGQLRKDLGSSMSERFGYITEIDILADRLKASVEPNQRSFNTNLFHMAPSK